MAMQQQMGEYATPDQGSTKNYIPPDGKSAPGDMAHNMDDGEEMSLFIPAKAFGKKKPTIGMSLSDFKVVDIDPETGEAEAKCTYDGKEDGYDGKPSYEKAFDKAMPEEEEM